jgi:SAM-dependent methyltransferase
VSIFEFVKEFAPGVEQVIALEPLQDEMNLVFTPPFNPVIRYMTGSGETMPWGLAEIFDFIYCVNVIDHTPNPQAMLDEIWKVLKPGGRVYFHVNFDETLWAGGHYELWNQTLVDERLAKFTLVEKYEYDRLQYHQHLYWAVYTK